VEALMAEKELISESRRAAELRATRAAAEFKHITEKLVTTEQRNIHLERLSQSQKTLIMDSNGIVEVGKHAMTVARQVCYYIFQSIFYIQSIFSVKISRSH
jgi:SRSO17 transposase